MKWVAIIAAVVLVSVLFFMSTEKKDVNKMMARVRKAKRDKAKARAVDVEPIESKMKVA